MTDEIEDTDQLPHQERAISDLLTTGRPVPAVGFRAAVRRRLVAQDPGYGTRPERLRLRVGGWLGIAAAFLAIGALQAAGLL